MQGLKQVNHSGDNFSHLNGQLATGKNSVIPESIIPKHNSTMEIEDDEKSLHNMHNTTRATFSSPDISHKKRRDTLNSAQTFQTSSPNFNNPAERMRQQIAMDELYFDSAFKKLEAFNLNGFLDNHEITEKYRGKMMDWMVEVLKTYNQKEETLFKAFYIMDLYFLKINNRVSANDLHLIGTVCMMIASKQEEISSMKLDFILNTVCRGKFTKEEVLDKEMEVLSAIEFKVHFPTVYEMSRCTFRLLEINDPEIRAFFENSVLYIAKMCLFSCDILSNFSFRDIVAFSAILSLKLVESLKKNFNSDILINKIIRKFALSEQTFISKLYTVHNFTLQFDSLIPYVKNLKKFYTFGAA